MQLFTVITGCLCFLLLKPVYAQKATVLKVVFHYDGRPNDPASDTVFHNINRPLKSADFTGTPSRNGRSEAVCYTSFSYDGNSRKLHDTIYLNLVLQVFMVKSSSWIRGTQSAGVTLVHEQMHFDITRIVGERFRKKIMEMGLSTEDYDSEVQYEYLEFFREMNRLQEAFDNETGNGTNQGAQDRWQRYIRTTLAELGVKPSN